MGEKAATDQDDGQAGAAPPDGVRYCSEHPYRRSGAAVAGGGICAFCLQEKLGRLVSSSKSNSPFFPLGGHPPPSASPPSFRRADEPPPRLRASRKFIPFHRKKTSTASATLSASMAGGGLKRTTSVAPRPEEQFPYSASSLTAESPRKKGFWSFMYLSSAYYAQQTAASTPYANGAAAAARRKSVSVAWAARGGAQDQQPRAGTSTLEAVGEPESPSQVSSIGRKVSRSRSVGCGSRSFSGDFLERLSNGFGDCTLRRAESHREPKPDKARRGGLGRLVADDDDDDGGGGYEHQHGMNMKCAGFFGGLGPAMPSYWLSAGGGVGGGRSKSGGRSHRRSWAWALASPVRALRPTRGSTSTKTITAVCTTSTSSLSISSPTQSSSEPTAAATN